MKSNGGGANAVLVRGTIAAHRAIRLRTWPERRVAQLLRLADGSALVNYHASSRAPRAREELARLRDLALHWAGESPLVLAGDFNLRSPALAGELDHVAARDVDHVFVRGYRAARPPLRLARDAVVEGREVLLSDHVPILVELEGPGPSGAI
jgi:endonuclease/exonuclease/phosphatase family metal-dependent hydrolase